MTELDASTPLKTLLVGEKTGLRGEQKKSISKTLLNTEIKGEKKACVRRGKIKS